MSIKKNLFAASLLVLGAAVAVPVQAQFNGPLGDRGPTNESFSGDYKNPEHRSAAHLSRALRYKEKAAKETDVKKQRKLLEKAKSELQSSIALIRNYDASVALGEVFIALGNQASAVDACTQALVFKPADANATRCIETAKSLQAPVDESTAPAAAGSSR